MGIPVDYIYSTVLYLAEGWSVHAGNGDWSNERKTVCQSKTCYPHSISWIQAGLC